MKIRMIFGMILSLTHLLFSLFALWLTLGWKVRKARKAFEEQLVRHGMAKKDAERLSAKYAELKDNVQNAFKQSLRNWR